MNKAKALSMNRRTGSAEAVPERFLVDIGHPVYLWLVEPADAVWALIKKEELGDALCDAQFLEQLLTTR